MEPRIMIILGSASDFAIAEKAIKKLETLEVPYDVRVASAHRTPGKVKKIVKESTEGGVEVFIAIAGLSAHLPGIIAANTHRPVIGVPVDVKFGGLDALFATVQMPVGVPVASVGVDRGDNAAIVAAQIVGTHDEVVRSEVSNMRAGFSSKIKSDETKLVEKVDGSYYSPKEFAAQGNTENEESTDLKGAVEDQVDVAVISESYSEMEVVKKTTKTLDELNITYDSAVVSPLRHPEEFESYMEQVKGAKLYIAVSGPSTHLAGAVVASSSKPVIGVPCAGDMNGLDALLSMVNMPPGVPTATVGVDSGDNAALLAAEILGLGDEAVESKLLKFKTKASG